MPTWSTLRRFWTLLWLLTVAAASGQPTTGTMEPYGKLQAKLDGQVLEDAEVFVSQGRYLLLASGLDEPLMIRAQAQDVARLDAAKIRRNDNGTVDVLEGASLGVVGPYQVSETELGFTLGKGRLTLSEKPWLLGTQSSDAIVAHDPSYAYRASLYPVSQPMIEKLRQETRQVEVKVFFGSWCGTCARYLPWLIEVEKALEGSSIRFEYIGLPKAEVDPVAEKNGITKLPTAIVSVDGKEVGRRTSEGLGVPEKALLELLGAG